MISTCLVPVTEAGWLTPVIGAPATEVTSELRPVEPVDPVLDMRWINPLLVLSVRVLV